MTTTCTMILGDCLEIIPTLPKSGVQMIFADLPYGTTANAWDNKICLRSFWDVISYKWNFGGRSIFTAMQPFAASLVASNLTRFSHELIWRKGQATNFLQAKRQPLRIHESILVFGGSTYNPIMWQHSQEKHGCGKRKSSESSISTYGRQRSNGRTSTTRYPLSVLDIRTRENGLHPTQKPVALLDWLIRTYSNEGDMVFDPTAGSFTTCVSAASCGRSSIGIERDEGYFEAGVERVRKHIRDNLLDVKLEVRK